MWRFRTGKLYKVDYIESEYTTQDKQNADEMGYKCVDLENLGFEWRFFVGVTNVKIAKYFQQ